jgi:ethanolamine transporter
VIVRIGVFLGGILPIFALIHRRLKKPLEWLAEKVQLSPKSISYLILSTSNDIPVLMNLKELEDDGITVNVAYLMAAAYTIGDFLAFSMQFAPKLAFPMMFGRLVSGFLMIVICLLKPVRSHAKQPAPVFSR